MKKYGLIGYPLEQSFSQKFFAAKFKNETINAEYLNFELESIGEFPEIIEDNETLKGLNVTIPYKERVMPFLTELDSEAEKVGAVNTIKICEKYGKPCLTGFNTDVYGFEETLKPYIKPHHTKALILGTGGASKAVRYVLNKLGIGFELVSTKQRKGTIGYADITDDIIIDHKLIINTTPLGMSPNTNGFPDLPYKAITTEHLLYDLIYNPAETVFLKNGKNNGATTVNGEAMLKKQAEKAWEIWNS